jgi:hypothetical protein
VTDEFDSIVGALVQMTHDATQRTRASVLGGMIVVVAADKGREYSNDVLVATDQFFDGCFELTARDRTPHGCEARISVTTDDFESLDLEAAGHERPLARERFDDYPGHDGCPVVGP